MSSLRKRHFVLAVFLVIFALSAMIQQGRLANLTMSYKSLALFESSEKKKKRPLRAFVCITGQLPRLKLKNKADRLMRHWYEKYGVEIDLALAISDTSFASKPRLQDLAEAEQEFSDMSQVVDFLESVPGVTVLNSQLFEAAMDPIVNQQYLQQRSGTVMSKENIYKRVQNHIRQFESMAKCHNLMVLSKKSYDIVHRVRDDSGYTNAVPFQEIFELTRLANRTIVSSGCQKHGGINDRGSFVSPDAAYDYFNHPIMHMYTQPLPTDIRNTEGFLLYTYSKTCTMVQTHQFFILKISDHPELHNDTVLGQFRGENEQGLALCVGDGSSRKINSKRKEECRTFSNHHKACVLNN